MKSVIRAVLLIVSALHLASGLFCSLVLVSASLAINCLGKISIPVKYINYNLLNFMSFQTKKRTIKACKISYLVVSHIFFYFILCFQTVLFDGVENILYYIILYYIMLYYIHI